MRFGCSTMFLEDRDVTLALEAIAAAGYEAAEVWVEHLQRRGEKAEDVAAVASKLGLQITVHAPFHDLNMLSVNEGIRMESLHQIREAIVLASKLGSKLVVVHPGKFSTSRDDPEEVWGRFVECAGLIDAWSGGVTVAIEMMEKKFREFFLFPGDAQRLMGQGFGNIRVTVDIAHFNTLADPVSLLGQMDPSWIAHVHLSQSVPGRTHSRLEKGEIDIDGVLAFLNGFYSGIVSIEGYDPGEGEDLVVSNRDFLRGLGY